LLIPDNQLSEWPAFGFFGPLSLQTLSLARNPLKALPTDAFLAASLRKLRVLDLTGFKAQLPPAPALSSLPHLEELRLGWVADPLKEIKNLYHEVLECAFLADGFQSRVGYTTRYRTRECFWILINILFIVLQIFFTGGSFSACSYPLRFPTSPVSNYEIVLDLGRR
jgi:hypothetical protein